METKTKNTTEKKTKILITGEELVKYMDDGNSLYETIQYANSLMPQLLSQYKLRRPSLKSQHSAKELKEYTTLFNKHEKDKKNYDRDLKISRKFHNDINTALEFLIKYESGFFDSVPEKYQSGVWQIAYDRGHSSGYVEVSNYLTDLVDTIFYLK